MRSYSATSKVQPNPGAAPEKLYPCGGTRTLMTGKRDQPNPDPAVEVAELRARLAEAEATLESIRAGGPGAAASTGRRGDPTSTPAQRPQTEEVLRFLVQCGSTPSGEDFFQALARYLAQSLGADFVCIDRLEEGSLAARTVAVFSDGNFQDNVTYTLKDTPCGDVVRQMTCCFPRNVRGLFPKDKVLQELLAEGYVGTTLWSSQGQPIGLIALIWRQPLADSQLATSILQLVAVRAAGELERRQAQQDLFETNQRLQALMRALPVGVSISDDPTCQRITGNLAVLAQFEVTAADNLSASAPDASVPGRQVRFFRAGQPITDADLPLQRAVAENREIPPIELEVLLPSGRRWVTMASGAPVRDQQGNVVGGVAVTQDITARKQAEGALARQREELQLILDSAPALIFYKDRENHFLRVNRAFADSMGLPKEQLEGRSLFDLYPRKQAEAFWRDDQEVLASGRPKTNIVEPMRTPAGDRWVQTSKVPCRNAQGNLTGVIGFALDITERKRAEEEIQRHLEELLAANAELTRFNEAMVGRELRMIELKKEIDALCAQLGQPPRYGPEPDEQARPAP